MRKSCAKSVQTLRAGRGLAAKLYPLSVLHFKLGGYESVVIPRLLRTKRTQFPTRFKPIFVSVSRLVVPTIHTANNNYNFIY